MLPSFREARLTERQQLLIALLLMILLAVSMVYCVGLGSAVLWQVSGDTPAASTPQAPRLELELTPLLSAAAPPGAPAASP